MASLSGSSIHVHAKHPRFGKPLRYQLLHLLGACPEPGNVAGAAGRTGFRDRLRVAAVMAVKLSVPVGLQAHITVGALDGLPAGAAGHEPGIASPV